VGFRKVATDVSKDLVAYDEAIQVQFDDDDGSITFHRNVATCKATVIVYKSIVSPRSATLQNPTHGNHNTGHHRYQKSQCSSTHLTGRPLHIHITPTARPPPHTNYFTYQDWNKPFQISTPSLLQLTTHETTNPEPAEPKTLPSTLHAFP
jgi:hypothetical protein